MSLVEVLVSMVVLVALSLGVFAGLDSSSRASGQSKSRSIAAALAQEDQERLRSIRIAELANRSTATTRTVEGVPFTIHSEARYVIDTAATTSCSSDSRADYIAIISEISWPAMGGIKPVRIESLIAPPTGSFSPDTGSIAVSVRNGDGAGVGGVPLAVSGPGSYGQTTNSLGCALFAYIAPGDWVLTLDAPGFVDAGGNQLVEVPIRVREELTEPVALDYARAAQAEVLFDTKRPSEADPQPATAEAVTLAHPTLPTGTRSFPDGTTGHGTDLESISAHHLFPFGSDYGVYSGICNANNPSNLDLASAATFLHAEPGGGHTVTVREPALDVRVVRAGTPAAGASVTFTSADEGCGNRFERTTGPEGYVAEPGLPFGNYVVCASDGERRIVVSDVANLDPAGTEFDVDLVGTASQEGTCPA